MALRLLGHRPQIVECRIEGLALSTLLDRRVVGAKRKDYPTIYMRGQAPGTFFPPPGSDVCTRLASDAEIVIGDRIALLDRRRAHASSPAQTPWISGAVHKRVTNKTDSDVRGLHGFSHRVLDRMTSEHRYAAAQYYGCLLVIVSYAVRD
jgi:hypothetical protein